MSVAPAAVTVLAVSRVVLSPAPTEDVKVKLSFLDAPWAATPPVQNVFLYQLAGGGDDEYQATVMRLKVSLATALALYLPMGGELKYVPDTGDVVVDCSDGAGVPFVEAKADMDVLRLAGKDVAHDVAAFLSLALRHDARVLPAPAKVVQATRLQGAGLALGVSVHHAVVDGRAMALFVDAWASACSGGSPAAATVNLLGPPDYGREAIARTHPSACELARSLLKKVAPGLPVANSKADYFSQRSQLARRTFFIGADDVRLLKRRIEGLASAAGEPAPKPAAVSTFVALVSLSCTGMVRAKGLSAVEDTYLTFYADLTSAPATSGTASRGAWRGPTPATTSARRGSCTRRGRWRRR